MSKLKDKNPIARASAVVLACFILAAFVVTVSFASRGSNDGAAFTGITSCEDSKSLLSLFPLARIRPGTNGASSGLEVHLSSADGHCSKIVFSSLGPGDHINSDYYLDNRDRAITLR